LGASDAGLVGRSPSSGGTGSFTGEVGSVKFATSMASTRQGSSVTGLVGALDAGMSILSTGTTLDGNSVRLLAGNRALSVSGPTRITGQVQAVRILSCPAFVLRLAFDVPRLFRVPYQFCQTNA
jgi:hypothetical protein